MDPVLTAQFGLFLAAQHANAIARTAQTIQGGGGSDWANGGSLTAQAAATRMSHAQLDITRLSNQMMGELLRLQSA